MTLHMRFTQDELFNLYIASGPNQLTHDLIDREVLLGARLKIKKQLLALDTVPDKANA